MSQTHILIIDDDEHYRITLADTLEASGYRVTVAEEGREGIARFKEDPADLVLTDVIMVGLDGIETILEFRKSYPKLKIIAMSGYGSHSDVYLKSCSLLGAQATLSKPFSLETLHRMIEKELGLQGENSS